MNYCSLEDAWGKTNYMSNQYKEYMNNKSDKNEQLTTKQVGFVEKFNDVQKKNIKNNRSNINYKKQEHFNNIYNCNDFFKHIKTCKRCYHKTKLQFKPKILENFQDIVECNKDTIVIILIGISILLFFNLLNNLTSNKNNNL